MTEPTFADNPAAHRVEARIGDVVAAYSEYRERSGRRSFTHTVVDPALEGQGLGSQLVRWALDDARARGLLVLPYCPFVRSWMKRHPEYVDLVPEAERAGFGL